MRHRTVQEERHRKPPPSAPPTPPPPPNLVLSSPKISKVGKKGPGRPSNSSKFIELTLNNHNITVDNQNPTINITPTIATDIITTNRTITETAPVTTITLPTISIGGDPSLQSDHIGDNSSPLPNDSNNSNNNSNNNNLVYEQTSMPTLTLRCLLSAELSMDPKLAMSERVNWARQLPVFSSAYLTLDDQFCLIKAGKFLFIFSQLLHLPPTFFWWGWVGYI
ncbi:unnamed protein product [Trichobilharzia regenti]|nr:unnamed protein product [Trichobilharzia regenti]